MNPRVMGCLGIVLVVLVVLGYSIYALGSAMNIL